MTDGSAYFNGTDRYLETTIGEELYIGLADFTIEAWVYLNSYTKYNFVTSFTDASDGSGAGSSVFGTNISNGRIYAEYGSTGYGGTVAQPLVPLKTWTHVAWVRKSGVLTMFANGEPGESVSFNFTLQNGSTGWSRIGFGRPPSSTSYFDGYISNLRVVVGDVVQTYYNSINILTPTSSLSTITDTSLLTLQNSTFIDNSTNTATLTVSGNTNLQSITTPYSTYAAYFDGTGDYITIPQNTSQFNLTGDFTIEFLIKPDTMTINNQGVISNSNASFNAGSFAVILNNASYPNKISVWAYNINSADAILSSNTLSTTNYSHILIKRSGIKLYLYQDGVLVDRNEESATTPTNLQVSSGGLRIGTYWVSSLKGYLSNLRIAKSIPSTYIAGFTPPTTTLSTYEQNETLVSGSEYFSGTSTSYVEINNNTGLNLSGSQYTIEMWLRPATTGIEQRILNKNAAAAIYGYLVYLSTTNQVCFRTDSTNIVGTATINTNEWSHIAVTNDGTTTRVYVNGALSNSATGVTITNESYNLRIGNRLYDGLLPYKGHISNVRIIKGTALYTGSTYTVPTAPLTAVTNTSLLTFKNTSGSAVDNSGNCTIGSDFGSLKLISPFNPKTRLLMFKEASVTVKPTTEGVTQPDIRTSSVLFSGTTSSNLLILTNSRLLLSGSPYTIEMWVYPTGLGTVDRRLYDKSGISTYPYVIGINAAGCPYFRTDNSNITGSLTAPLNTWTHIAVTFDGTATRLYVNGKQSISVTGVSIVNEDVDLRIGGAAYLGGSPFMGYISNLRVVKGTALYTSEFTPSTTAALTAITNTSLLIANARTTYQSAILRDESTNALTSTVAGNSVPNLFTPFNQGYYSIGFKSSAYSTVTNTTALNLSGSAYTIEAWVYPKATGTERKIINKQQGTSTYGYTLHLSSTGLVEFKTDSTTLTSTTTAPINTWTHIAVTNDGTTTRLFVNGQLATSATGVTISNEAFNPRIAARSSDGLLPFTGNISNLRIVKGSAVYTANFTPSTTPLTAISGTSLLTALNPNFSDISGNNQTITRSSTSNITVDMLYPFEMPITTNGSAYFDGSGDYLSFADNTLLDMEASNFTIEGWHYPQSNTGAGLVSKRATTAVFAGISLDLLAGITPKLLVTVNGTSWGINATSTVSFNLNAWNHFAIVRNASAWTVYINGIAGISSTLAGTVPNNTAAFVIGAQAADGSNASIAGYISNFRVVKGTAVYTAAFTPPTAPLTQITNTSILTCASNLATLDPVNNYIFSYSTTVVNTPNPWEILYSTPVDSTYLPEVTKDYSAFATSQKFTAYPTTTSYATISFNPFSYTLDVDPQSETDLLTYVVKNSPATEKRLTITTSDALNNQGIIDPQNEVQTVYGIS